MGRADLDELEAMAKAAPTMLIALGCDCRDFESAAHRDHARRVALSLAPDFALSMAAELRAARAALDRIGRMHRGQYRTRCTCHSCIRVRNVIAAYDQAMG